MTYTNGYLKVYDGEALPTEKGLGIIIQSILKNQSLELFNVTSDIEQWIPLVSKRTAMRIDSTHEIQNGIHYIEDKLRLSITGTITYNGFTISHVEFGKCKINGLKKKREV